MMNGLVSLRFFYILLRGWSTVDANGSYGFLFVWAFAKWSVYTSLRALGRIGMGWHCT